MSGHSSPYIKYINERSCAVQRLQKKLTSPQVTSNKDYLSQIRPTICTDYMCGYVFTKALFILILWVVFNRSETLRSTMNDATARAGVAFRWHRVFSEYWQLLIKLTCYCSYLYVKCLLYISSSVVHLGNPIPCIIYNILSSETHCYECKVHNGEDIWEVAYTRYGLPFIFVFGNDTNDCPAVFYLVSRVSITNLLGKFYNIIGQF